MRIDAPCMGCADRKPPYCHGTCQRYLQYLKQKQAQKAEMDRRKEWYGKR